MFIHIWRSYGNIDTSPCRSNIQSRPKGNEGLAALVGLAHASRAGPSHPRSGGIVPRSSVGHTVARNTHRNTKRCYNEFSVWLWDDHASSSWLLKDTYHYHFRLRGWEVSCLFITITRNILPHDPRWWSFPVRAMAFDRSNAIPETCHSQNSPFIRVGVDPVNPHLKKNELSFGDDYPLVN